MQTEETRQLVQTFLAARAANDAETMAGLLAADAAWYPPPSMKIGPFHGGETVTKALSGGAVGRIFDVTTMKRTVHKLIVEGDTAVALQRLEARTIKGEDYANEYVWIYTCADGKIVSLVELTDSLYAARTFGMVS